MKLKMRNGSVNNTNQHGAVCDFHCEASEKLLLNFV